MTGNKFIIDSTAEPDENPNGIAAEVCQVYTNTEGNDATRPLKAFSFPSPIVVSRQAVFSLGFKVPEAMNSRENE